MTTRRQTDICGTSELHFRKDHSEKKKRRREEEKKRRREEEKKRRA